MTAEIGPMNLALLPVDIEAQWQRGPLEKRARKILDKQELPDWKFPEIVRNVERIFDAALALGKSPKDALMHVDAEIEVILASNTHVGERT